MLTITRNKIVHRVLIPHQERSRQQLIIRVAYSQDLALIQALGLCPIIAISTTLQNGVVMAACTAAVMLPLSLMTALLSNSLPKWLRPAV